MRRRALLAVGLVVLCRMLAPPVAATADHEMPLVDRAAPAPARAPLEVLRPAAESLVAERRPQLLGTGEHPGMVAVMRYDDLLCANTPVRPDGSWSCRPRRDLPPGRVSLLVVQRDPSDDVTGRTRHTFFVRPPIPAITRPADGRDLRTRRPSFSGRVDLDPRDRTAAVRVVEGSRTLCTARVSGNGRWSCRTRVRLEPRRHRVSALAVVGAVESPRADPVTFVVRRLAPPPTPVPPPDPPSPLPPAEPSTQPAEPASHPPPPAPQPEQTGPTPEVPESGEGARRAPAPEPTASPDPGAARGSQPIRLMLSRPAPDLLAGTMSALTAVLGPHHGDTSVRLRVTGTLASGLLYRAVTGLGDERCIVGRRAFACSLVLLPGRRAVLRMWMTADGLRPPAQARQRLRVAASDPSLDASRSWSHSLAPIGSDGSSADPPSLARETASSPGTFLPLLALFLLALAAEAARRQPSRRS